LLQQKLIAKASGVPDEIIKKTTITNTKVFDLIVKSKDDVKLKSDLTNLLNASLENDVNPQIPDGMTKEKFVSIQMDQILSPWMQYFIKFNPATTLKKVKCPVLALNGEKDLQVPPKENLSAIKNALKKGGNQKVTTIEFKGLNHLFQECTSGSPSEYATIEQTFAPIALDEIKKWIIIQTK